MASSVTESPLTGHFYPRRHDSHLASKDPEASFLDFFKQSLIYTGTYCTDSACCSAFTGSAETEANASEIANTTPASQSTAETAPLSYPLCLFEDSRDLPPLSVLRPWAQEFHRRLVPSVPFLQNLSCAASQEDHDPIFLFLAKAILGSTFATAHQTQVSVQRLWTSTTALLVALIEVDNSLGRTVSWSATITLLVAYGFMQADIPIWRETNVISGYVHGGIYRPGFLSRDIPARNNTSPYSIGSEVTQLRKLFFLVDTMRSIYLQSPPTTHPAWTTRIGPNNAYDLKQLYTDIFSRHKPVPQELNPEEVILILLHLLADINILFCSIGPFTTTVRVVRDRMRVSSTTPDAPDLSESYRNPFVPFSPDREYERIRRKLKAAIPLLQLASNTDPPNQRTGVNPNMLGLSSLLSFCKLLIEAGPTIYMLPLLVGYGSGPAWVPNPDSLSSTVPHTIGISFSDTALTAALEVLEVVEMETKSRISTIQSQTCSQMWYPLALFYAALAIWARMLEDDSRPDGNIRLKFGFMTPRRTLSLFKFEMENIGRDWPCARRMAAIITKILTDSSTERL